MGHLSRTLGLLLLLCHVGLVHADDRATATAEAGADEEDHEPPAETERHDYSRYKDGPRWVPTARGASLARAQHLGLGTLDTAKALLRHAPEARWVKAASGRVERPFFWPVDEGRFGRGFGFTRRERTDLKHRGVDIVAETGQPVRAVADGIVAYSDNGIRGFGNCVILIHPDGLVSLYAHNTRTTVQAGYRVKRGERIALVGATGIARGPHLHFELRKGGRTIDPRPYFPALLRRIPTEQQSARDDLDVPLSTGP